MEEEQVFLASLQGLFRGRGDAIFTNMFMFEPAQASDGIRMQLEEGEERQERRNRGIPGHSETKSQGLLSMHDALVLEGQSDSCRRSSCIASSPTRATSRRHGVHV